MSRPHPESPPEAIGDGTIELRLLRVLGPADAASRPPEARFLAVALEWRFAIHLTGTGARVGRIHLRPTDDATILRAVGHAGYAVDAAYQRQGIATRALRLVRALAAAHGIVPLQVLVAPENVASRRTAERAGLHLVDIVPATAEALAMGLGPTLCRYATVDDADAPAGAHDVA